MGTIVSPRTVSGVTRSDNHAGRRPVGIGMRAPARNAPNKSTLPDIIKRGPINNRNNPKKVVGLSLQKKEEGSAKFIRAKRGSLEQNKQHRNSKARNAILRA